MKSSIKESLKQRAFQYLDERLDVHVKKSITSVQIKQILECLSDWMYEERVGVMHEFSRQVIQKVQNKPSEILEDSEFVKELQKL